ncbi:hypothetical protein EJ04DRAFT_554610 [Polyplosphaeria fusca]|uniref:Protein kinase domain-containing protein n=1 Tax=Polyplosphaeria fusca TaxID=682080 RepID=A0A9P4QV98_9PLEO|nr:hypothetical protein EJ04DRAFT_554610 [Polyplosphaeria fusca]
MATALARGRKPLQHPGLSYGEKPFSGQNEFQSEELVCCYVNQRYQKKKRRLPREGTHCQEYISYRFFEGVDRSAGGSNQRYVRCQNMRHEICDWKAKEHWFRYIRDDWLQIVPATEIPKSIQMKPTSHIHDVDFYLAVDPETNEDQWYISDRSERQVYQIFYRNTYTACEWMHDLFIGQKDMIPQNQVLDRSRLNHWASIEQTAYYLFDKHKYRKRCKKIRVSQDLDWTFESFYLEDYGYAGDDDSPEFEPYLEWERSTDGEPPNAQRDEENPAERFRLYDGFSWNHALLEDVETGKWSMLLPPVDLAVHIGHVLKTNPLTPSGSKWIPTGLEWNPMVPGRTVVKYVCTNQHGAVLDRLVAKPVARRSEVEVDRADNGEIYLPDEDIKPQNVFLMDARSENYPAYKWPVLGDFEMYFRLDKDLMNDQTGTEGWQAPEQQGPFPMGTLNTDIWQIGLVIWALMRNQTRGFDLEEFQKMQRYRRTNTGLSQTQSLLNNDLRYLFDRKDEQLKANRQFDDLYSTSLNDLVWLCLKQDSLKRPSFHHLVQQVEKKAKKYSEFKGGVQQLSAESLPEWLRVVFGQESFRLGQYVNYSSKDNNNKSQDKRSSEDSVDLDDEEESDESGGLGH